MAENRPYMDFKAIKQRVAIADVLARYGVKLVRVNQTAMRGSCPLPSHSSKSQNTFYVNEAKSVWYCHSDSCKKNGARAGGNVIDFVALMEQCSIYDAAKGIGEWFPAESNHAGAVRPAKEANGTSSARPSDVANPVANAGRNQPLAFVLKDVNPSHPMIQERGISVETARAFGVGFFPGKGSMAGRVVFPLHEDGNLVGYAGRTTLPVSDTNPKWLFGKGLRKTFLYGLERCDPAKPLILRESLWGPLWFHEHGLQAASLMGSEMTEAQEKSLDAFAVITVGLDDDAAGIEKAARISARLRTNHRILKARLKG